MDELHFLTFKRVFLGVVCGRPDSCCDVGRLPWCSYCRRGQNWTDTTINIKDEDMTFKMLCGLSHRQHQMVDKGSAYWIDNNTLLTGYTLKNTNIWRPIFSGKREKIFAKLRYEIKKYSGFMRKLRQNIVRRGLLATKLPTDIIWLIATY